MGSHADGELIRRDVHPVEPHLAVEDARISIGNLHLAGAQALHFASVQHNSRLDHIQDDVVVACLAIARQRGVR